MVTYTMCSNQECPQADYCERFTAKRGKKCLIKYFLNNGDNCEAFIGNEKYKTWAILSGHSPKAGYKSLNEFQSIGRWNRIKDGEIYENGIKFTVLKSRQSCTINHVTFDGSFWRIQPK